ncbi:hypothetical protein PH586_10650 [Pseudomonas sp. SA3-5]|uniref:Uncharacterized protein n=1 Tax=Pseudomonas aestuarii TaxID=3018340 RepID=A0ABT4XF44_9PSED|nr:hypothetical protein [Pseudomonas aestuarii]MDA7086841.1 hypothetical protein [Pseudomonas aestuarii]
MKDAELCRWLLEVNEPWEVSRVRVDTHSREVHAYLSTGKTWFGRYLGEQPRSRWRHVNIGAYKTYIHASLPEQDEQAPQAFLGRSASDFTHGLARRVIQCLQDGLRYRQVCALLDIDIHLAWQIKHAIESGQLATADTDLRARLQLDDSAGQTGSSIPASDDRIWLRLLAMDCPFEIRLLSLKLLLARARQDFARAHDPDMQILRINELRRFFIKHEKHLQHEIAQLNNDRQPVTEGDQP